MATARDVVATSMRLIGVLAAGETPKAQEQTDAISALNRMLDSWSTQSLLVFNRVSETFTPLVNKQTYTMGIGGDFNTTRPQKIEAAGLLIQGSQPYELPLDIYNLDQWSAITVKALQSTLPQCLYADNAYPLMNLNFWPISNQVNGIVIYSWKPLTTIATPDDVISFPPGYEEAIIYNLAGRLAPEYGRQLDPVVLEIAGASKESIQRMNIRPLYLSQDEALLQRDRPFNWLTGEG